MTRFVMNGLAFVSKVGRFVTNCAIVVEKIAGFTENLAIVVTKRRTFSVTMERCGENDRGFARNWGLGKTEGDRLMQKLAESSRKHLSHDAALMLLAVLPDHIRDAYITYAQQIGYSIELVLEMALADFLDPDSLTFADCKPRIGVPLESG
ncbi:hypothetical protein [Leptolyngbya sp. GGD]|uniref:hypothetical protein n=1 Tax=Leptolyngbya sp. GGD TaxID=2997907 RepID=UPI00227A2E97|nr:hypothetical protein [Leptolyngbya sp. GGD]MCY6489184.1 hypothetical protein [Leptolyngbya sp. GGD]